MGIKTSKFQEIMHEYQVQRMSQEQLLLEKKNQLYEDHPDIKKLEDKLTDLSMDKAILLIQNGSDQALASLSEEIEALRTQKQELLVNYGYSSDYLTISYTCPDCKDTGFIGSDKCRCLKKRLIHELYAQSRIQSILEKENFTYFTDKYYNDSEKAQMDKTLVGVRRFIDTFDTSFQNLLFFGQVGSGKTFLSNCIAKELLDSGHSVIYFTSYQLFTYIADRTFNRSDAESYQELEDLYDCDLLVIDDLGTESYNSFTVAQFFLILNERLGREKSTIISSNLSPQKLNDIYTERSLSRILGSYNLYQFSGRDMRSLMRAHK